MIAFRAVASSFFSFHPAAQAIARQTHATRLMVQGLSAVCASVCLGLALSTTPAHAGGLDCKSTWSPSMRKLVEVLETIETRHADAKVSDKLVARVMDHLAKEMDPYANYYDVEAYKELRRNLEGRSNDHTSLDYRLLPGARGYVHIHNFDEKVPALLVRALSNLESDARGGLQGLVLDLRDNPGGLVRSAVGVAAVFLPANALVIRTEGDGVDAKQELRATPNDYLDIAEDDYLEGLPRRYKSLPLTVLVNKGSASASEILAGALQDHSRAVIIGTRTYGKGTVQTIIPLDDDTAIKFTTAFFYTPSGRKVDGQGVNPDLQVRRRAATDKVAADSSSAPAPKLPVTATGTCALKGATEGMREVNGLSGEDSADCQLQQAIVTLSARRVADVR